jgi:SAM-dependent methyltransferase
MGACKASGASGATGYSHTKGGCRFFSLRLFPQFRLRGDEEASTQGDSGWQGGQRFGPVSLGDQTPRVPSEKVLGRLTMEEQRLQREEVFHDQVYKEHGRRSVSKYYRIMEPLTEAYEGAISSRCTGKRVLEYGCGKGRYLGLLAEKADSVTAIDISGEAVEQAREAARSEGLANVDVRVMNAESLQFADGAFDLVCGSAIVHHLDLHKTFSEVARVLSPEGVAIFIEPMGHNPLINLYRSSTPHLRTEDEHPLRLRDLQLAGSFFEVVNVSYFYLLTLAAVPFRNARFFSGLLGALGTADRYLFRALPFAKRYAWYAMITLERPKRLAPNPSHAPRLTSGMTSGR